MLMDGCSDGCNHKEMVVSNAQGVNVANSTQHTLFEGWLLGIEDGWEDILGASEGCDVGQMDSDGFSEGIDEG